MRAAVLAGIFARTRTRNLAPLSTLDVRQIRRWCLGRWKAPGMKSNLSVWYLEAVGQPSLPEPLCAGGDQPTPWTSVCWLFLHLGQ